MSPSGLIRCARSHWVSVGGNLEPIVLEVVVVAKVSPMTTENDALREDLRAWIKSPAIGLPDYSADLLIRRRVGGMLADACAILGSRTKESAKSCAEPLSGISLVSTRLTPRSDRTMRRTRNDAKDQ